MLGITEEGTIDRGEIEDTREEQENTEGQTARISGDLFVAIGRVERNANSTSSYTHGVFIKSPEGQCSLWFALGNDEVIQHRLEGGDHVVVRFSLDDQFAYVISMKDIAKSLIG